MEGNKKWKRRLNEMQEPARIMKSGISWLGSVKVLSY